MVGTTSNSETASLATPQAHTPAGNRRLKIALSLAFVALLLQLFPGALGTGLHYVDVRNWHWAVRLTQYVQVFAEEHRALTILFRTLIVLGAILVTWLCTQIRPYHPEFVQFLAEANKAAVFCITLVVNSLLALGFMIVILNHSAPATPDMVSTGTTNYVNPLNWSLPVRLVVNLLVLLLLVYIVANRKKLAE